MTNAIKTIHKTKIFTSKRAKGKHRTNEHISGRNWRRHLQTNSENVEMSENDDEMSKTIQKMTQTAVFSRYGKRTFV